MDPLKLKQVIVDAIAKSSIHGPAVMNHDDGLNDVCLDGFVDFERVARFVIEHREEWDS